jgi:hypothetical protein
VQASRTILRGRLAWPIGLSPQWSREEAFVTLHLSESLVVRDQDIQTRLVRAEGTSGNNRHHKAIAVEVRYDVARASLPDDAKTVDVVQVQLHHSPC